ncbi:GPI-anchored cell wall beta-1,3-endoglucanase EglC [Lophium mytilinum]|uniref:Probable glucan endo-1,3-beta-glucosidase eglC n=1 Tax=Lophium mytilinum TaxID=390894 RepID=A0A6A6QB03_9PEZI|nr:GPI-anchored cell wall beta-1,3-endoglucanase EglC [Lophium mytilinum]
MRLSSTLLGVAAVLGAAEAQLRGFNYGANFLNNQAKVQADFEYEFNKAKSLPGTSGWTSARLYTTIQHGTTKDPISAIPAAINTKTKLLLGLWASGTTAAAGQANINNEIAALKSAIAKYGTKFTDLVVGISVGSEDLYRITPTGIKNKAGAGAQPADLIKYVKQLRAAIKGTKLASTPVGHVDTWTVYPNATNAAFISNLDFLGVDAYPYFQTTMANSIGHANATFYDAYNQVKNVKAAKGKAIWITETGWPVSGPKQNQAVASAANARIYWQDVACSLLAKKVNLFWYDLQEAQYGNPSPDFGIFGAGDLGTLKPRYSLSC